MLLDWWERHRRLILIAAALLFLAVSFWLYPGEKRTETVGVPLVSPAYAEGERVGEKPEAGVLAPQKQEPAPARGQPAAAHPKSPAEPEAKSAPPPLYVDVKGKVKKPGLYRFAPGMRVADAIEEAGGALPEADLDQINLAEPLADGTALFIPAKGSTAGGPVTAVGAPPLSPVPASGTRAAGAGGAVPTTKPLNLNTATVDELMSLPGIGEARANAILEYRAQVGRFRSSDELQKVSGIGSKMFARIKDRIVAQ
ncbi:helix-hairpin-helix domain-containing protein [Brevibacillus sp. SAFN-007a]|uniref:helix-hairpin-helix domain-containing protein n=1 Tax=Brevibacillus sp. SAFN-007a TaxID=3436862 RepID=UPI003F7E64A9